MPVNNRKKILQGINSKVVLTMFIVVLSITTLIALYSYFMTKEILIRQAEQEMAVKNDNVKNAITAFFEQQGKIVQQLAADPVVENFFEKNIDREHARFNGNYKWLQKILNNVIEQNPNIHHVQLAHIKNSYFIGEKDYISDENYVLQNRPWYKEAEKTEGLLYSSPYLDYASQTLSTSISYPISLNGERVGYFGVSIKLADLGNILEPLETDGRKIILISADNEVLYGSEEMWTMFQEDEKLKEEMFKCQDETHSYYASVRQLDGMDWKVALYVPEELVLAPLTGYKQSIFISWAMAISVLLMILYVVLNYYLRDIPKIVQEIIKIKNGDFNVKMDIQRHDEIGEIVQAVEQMSAQIKQHIDELDYQATHDVLTGVMNRYAFERRLQACLAEMPSTEMLGIAFLDLDQFKYINDSKGHAYGDALLVAVSNRIIENMPKTGFFGRFGGDEFVMAFRVHSNQEQRVIASVNKVHRSFEEPFVLLNQQIHVTASIGVAFYPKDAKTLTELLIYADTALYAAKEAGRNRVQLFTTTMKQRIDEELLLKEGIRTAISKKEFFLHYQPQLSLDSDGKTSVEALIRWKHPQIGFVSPAQFIPIAENTGQIVAIGDWVIEASLQMWKRLKKRELPLSYIAINVSAMQLRESDFVEKLKAKLHDYEVPAEAIEIEITESVIMDNPQETIAKLLELKELGIKIALDDFGTGYSSLSYLRTMPIDRVKVDRSFINEMENDSMRQSILQTIITLGRELNFQIVAEGVEEKQQLELLKRMQVDQIQGYYYSKPLDEQSLQQFLQGRT